MRSPEPKHRNGTSLDWVAVGFDSRTRLKTLNAAAIVLAVVGVWFGIGAYRAQQAIAQNTAHVDLIASQDVASQVSDTVKRAFSFDYTRTAETEEVAKERLHGQALAEHQRLFEQVREQGGPQRLILTTTVKSAGVMSMREDEARLLLFADQLAVRAGTDQHSVGPAQLEVTAHRYDGGWKITEIVLL